MHLTHAAKQVIGAAATPLACGLLMLLAGAAARWAGWRRTSTGLWTAAAILVYLSATGPVANALLAPLEARYPVLSDAADLKQVHYIVVLGSSYAPHDGIPITGALGGDGLSRIAEGVRLARKAPGSILIVSGGSADGKPTTAEGYARFAVDFGIDPKSIVKLDKSLDTEEEARSVVALIGRSQFILVTSAYHMPRAVRLMERAGAHPIPAPTGQLGWHAEFDLRAWIPRSSSIYKTECALHEYMGLALVK
jgi:uncharacterized SAM-binding protein YcdF (DUF218 family)